MILDTTGHCSIRGHQREVTKILSQTRVNTKGGDPQFFLEKSLKLKKVAKQVTAFYSVLNNQKYTFLEGLQKHYSEFCQFTLLHVTCIFYQHELKVPQT